MSGDYALFMSGMFRKHVEGIGSLEYYIQEGSRSYWTVSELDLSLYRTGYLLYQELSKKFEYYSGALDYTRKAYFAAAPGEDPFAGFVRQIEGWMKVNTTENWLPLPSETLARSLSIPLPTRVVKTLRIILLVAVMGIALSAGVLFYYILYERRRRTATGRNPRRAGRFVGRRVAQAARPANHRQRIFVFALGAFERRGKENPSGSLSL